MLSPQKYQNTSRTITGLLNFVFTSDVLIFCDTSAGAVAITLLEIPSNFWNTSYKLYIIDANNNAQTNNITINAPVGFQVNNASNLVISTNGGIALIRIVNNTDYLAEFNFNAGGLAVLNEGVLLTPNATSMDFIGSYVNATNVGSAVSVFVQPSIISLTYAQLQTAITNSTLIAGQMYSITNATFIQTTSETAPIYLLATSTNTISAEGQGRFLNADYQLVGNYSGVTGFVNALGVWNLLAPVVVGSVVIWNNFHYVSLTGINNQPNLNPLDWALLTKTLTTGYILEVCTILYDVNTNSIYKRIDLNNNSVENNISTYISVGIEAFQVFQWGAPILCRDNLISNESVLNNCNNQGLVISNSIQNASIVKIQHGGTSQQTELKQNFICENSSLTFTIDSNLNRFNNNNVRNRAIVTFDPLGDPNPTLGLIAENDFVNCELTLGVFLFADILRGNVFNGVVGQIINFQGTFTNNSFISSSSYTFAISNQGTGTTGNFSANQINYCNVDINNLGNFVENILEYSTINIGSNTSSGNIQKNVLNNSTWGISIQNNSNIRFNNFFDSQITFVDNNGNIQYNQVTDNSTLQISSNSGSFTNNNIDFSTLTIDSLGITSFASNIIENLSIISITNCANSIAQNNFYRFTFQVTTNNCNVFRNNLRSSGIVVTDLSTTTLTDILGNLNILFAGVFTEAISSGVIQEGLTSTSISLDVQNGAIYDAITQTLTIPNELTNVCGIIVLQNGVAPITISKISGGLPTGFGAMKFINSTGFNVDFVSTPIGIAVNDDIISNLAPNTYTIVDRVNGGDTIQIIRSGNFVAIQEVYIYI